MSDVRSSSDADGGDGFYCSTSGATFTEREALADHYRSELHRYNLKRKVAGECALMTWRFIAMAIPGICHTRALILTQQVDLATTLHLEAYGQAAKTTLLVCCRMLLCARCAAPFTTLVQPQAGNVRCRLAACDSRVV
jgi:hypothetical protein